MFKLLIFQFILRSNANWAHNSICMEKYDIRGDDNGELKCNGPSCEIFCKKEFDHYGGPRKVNCKVHQDSSKGTQWNHQIGVCRPCVPIVPQDEGLVKQCRKSATTGIYNCQYSCKQKNHLIMPIKRKNFLVGCRCRWKIDEQEICHWRRAKTNKIYDEEIQNWYCAQREAVSFELAPAGLPPNLKYCKAGTRFNQRIFGGKLTSLERWPWIVRIEFGNRRCGGTLISESRVLTAAHCCSGFENDLENVRIYLNEEDALLFEENEIIRNPVTMKIHENYKTTAFHDDLCVLHFQLPKSSSVKNHPVCLPDSSTLAPTFSSKCFIAGWGKTSFSPHEEANHKLNEVDVKIWNNAKCKNALSSENLDLTKMLCAGWKEGVKDSCQGDSGGPLVCVEDQRAILFGVTSWGVGCGMPDSPGVYVRIMHYLPWLNKI